MKLSNSIMFFQSGYYTNDLETLALRQKVDTVGLYFSVLV
jgi:hypothetical protein